MGLGGDKSGWLGGGWGGGSRTAFKRDVSCHRLGLKRWWWRRRKRRQPQRGGGGGGGGSTWFQERAAVVGFQFRGEGQRQQRAPGNAWAGGALPSAREPGRTLGVSEEEEEAATQPRVAPFTERLRDAP